MAEDYVHALFGLQEQVAVVTGATGVLGGAMARGLTRAGAKVAILGVLLGNADLTRYRLLAFG